MTHEQSLALRQRVVDAIVADVSGFKLRFKDEDKVHALITRCIDRLPLPDGGILKTFWRNWLGFFTTIWPTVWVSNRGLWDANPKWTARVMQHEHVHLKDAESFFGLLPRRLKYINVILFSIAYTCPQLIATMALLAPIAVLVGGGPMHWLMLLFALFLVPMPSPGRMYAEMRAYRRSVELGADPEIVQRAFTGSKYWYMWPFKKHVLKMLRKPSPYREEMDATWRGNG